MKIAIISQRKPSLDTGSEARNYYLAKGLSKQFFVKVFIPTVDNPESKQINIIKSILTRFFYLFQAKIPYIELLKKAKFDNATLKELQTYDVIQLEEMSAFIFFEKYFPFVKGKIVLDTHNIDYMRFLAEVESKNKIEKYIGRLLARNLKQMEMEAVKKCDHILVCSTIEKKYFSQYIRFDKISIVSNGAQVNQYEYLKKSNSNTVLFMGLLSYQPNDEGLRYYLNFIHPKVLEKNPNSHLIILGREPRKWLKNKAKHDKSINLLGFVPSVEPYVKKATVCICPILSGSGTRLKLLEYMAAGKAIVSTTIGAEGITVTNKKNILIADNHIQFSNSVSRLLSDYTFSSFLGSNAKKLIKKSYSWSKITNELCDIYKKMSL